MKGYISKNKLWLILILLLIISNIFTLYKYKRSHNYVNQRLEFSAYNVAFENHKIISMLQYPEEDMDTQYNNLETSISKMIDNIEEIQYIYKMKDHIEITNFHEQVLHYYLWELYDTKISDDSGLFESKSNELYEYQLIIRQILRKYDVDQKSFENDWFIKEIMPTRKIKKNWDNVLTEINNISHDGYNPYH